MQEDSAQEDPHDDLKRNQESWDAQKKLNQVAETLFQSLQTEFLGFKDTIKNEIIQQKTFFYD